MNEIDLDKLAKHAKEHLDRVESKQIKVGDEETADTWNFVTYVQHFSEEESKEIASAVTKLVEYLRQEQFDYLIIGGSSRLVLKSLLIGLDIGQTKIIELEPEENYSIYTRNDTEPDFRQIGDDNFYQKRADLALGILERKAGIKLTGKKVGYLDDHVSEGYKSREVILIFKKLSQLQTFQFLSLTGPYNLAQFKNRLGEDFEKYFRFFLDWEKKPPIMRTLKEALAVADPQKQKEFLDYSVEGGQFFRNYTRDIIKSIRNSMHS